MLILDKNIAEKSRAYIREKQEAIAGISGDEETQEDHDTRQVGQLRTTQTDYNYIELA